MSALNKLVVSTKPNFFDIITYINKLLDGCMNPVGTVTLTNGTTSTVLSDNHIKRGSIVGLDMPQTADASAVTGIWLDPASIPAMGGQITIHHSLIAVGDATFGYKVHT